MAAKIKSDDDVLALHEEYMEGASLLDLAIAYGMCPGTISGHFKRLGLHVRPKGDRAGRPQRNVANAAPAPSGPSIKRVGPVGPRATHRRRGRGF
jgi:hypothetical protein